MVTLGSTNNKRKQSLTPTQYVFISFVLVILTGAVLLYLPISQANTTIETSFIDALFTATSATCVTGLVVVTTATHWTLFGQLVILALIQIGGLTFITLYAFVIIYIGKKVTLKDRLMIQSAFNQNSLQGMAKLVLMVIKGTFLVEGIAAIILAIAFYNIDSISIPKAIYYGIFHAISGFCNAGFDVIGENSLANYTSHPIINLVIMTLIVLGGIGFTVWKDIKTSVSVYIKDKLNKRSHTKHRFAVHTKIALAATIFLIVLGALYFFIFEHHNPGTLGKLPLDEKIMASFFQSVTLRTAGFFTIDQNALSEASKFISSLFMIIGGSPGGTAGGIKTVTIAMFFCCMVSVLKGNDKIIIMNRKIPTKSFFKAVVITVLMVCLLFVVTAILAVTEDASAFEHTFLDIMFETSSALGTVGLTTGITPHLTNIGKLLLTCCMFIGRLGPVSVVMAISNEHNNTGDGIIYPEEEILIG